MVKIKSSVLINALFKLKSTLGDSRRHALIDKVLVESAESNTLTLSTFDLVTRTRINIPCVGYMPQPKLISYSDLLGVALSGDYCNINGNCNTTIASDSTQLIIGDYNLDFYPLPPTISSQSPIHKLNKVDIDRIKILRKFTSTDTLTDYCGVIINNNQASSTDGITFASTNLSSDIPSLVLPNKVIDLLPNGRDIYFHHDGNQIRIIDELEITTVAWESPPLVTGILNESPSYRISINRELLIRYVDVVNTIFNTISVNIRLHIKHSSMHLSIGDSGKQLESNLDITGIPDNDTELTIHLNSKALTKCLRALPSDIVMEIQSARHPISIRTNDITVIMLPSLY